MKNEQNLWFQKIKEYLLLIINNEDYRQNEDNGNTFFYEMTDYYEDKTIDCFLSRLLTCGKIDRDIFDKTELLADNFIAAEKIYQSNVPEEFWKKQKSIALAVMSKLDC